MKIKLPVLGLIVAATVWTLFNHKQGKTMEKTSAVTVSCETTKGNMEIVVRPSWSPLGAERFLQLVDDGFFQNIPLFRCVDNFLCQFGAALPRKDAKAYSPIRDDPKLPELRRFKRGFMSFAGNGENSRATHMFITLGENVESLGTMPWETPFGYVTPESMEKTVSRFTTSYGDIAPWGKGPDPGRIGSADGAEYLKQNFPQLDYIVSCKRR
jgi:cyclophilin family peptidyl-prolyl cis-trans isomerase